MSFPATLPAPILETIITHLTTLFLAGAHGCPTAARQAAIRLIAGYHPTTEDELRLAANIAIFSFEALQALRQSGAPDLSTTRIHRLRSSAVSLSREAARAERRLIELRNPRKPPVQAEAAKPSPEPAPEPVPKPATTVAAAAKAKNLTWTQAYQQRQRDRRLAANRQKAAAQGPAATPVATPDDQPDGAPVTPGASDRSAPTGSAMTTKAA